MKKSFTKTIGQLLVKALPLIIKGLAIVGTIALLLVAGGIFLHNIEYLHDLLHGLPSIVAEFLVGLAVGIVTLVIIKAFKKSIFKQENRVIIESFSNSLHLHYILQN